MIVWGFVCLFLCGSLVVDGNDDGDGDGDGDVDVDGLYSSIMEYANQAHYNQAHKRFI